MFCDANHDQVLMIVQKNNCTLLTVNRKPILGAINIKYP